MDARTPACAPRLDFGAQRAQAATLLILRGAHVSERYSTAVRCAGERLLFSRTIVAANTPYPWQSVVRRQSGRDGYGRPMR
eukprot:263461-Prymnesium_polylepis.1